MKALLLISLGFLALLTAAPLCADEASSLPFPVTVGGQAATAKSDEPFAKIEKPVAADAPIEVGAKGEMIILNVTPSSAKGEPTQGGSPAIIILQNTQKSSLDKTLDSQKLKSGNYVLSVVAEGKTASILLQIQ